MPFTSDRRLYLNADRSKVVEEGDPDSAYLLVGEGGEVSDEDAKQYGLKAPRKSEAKADDAEAKQVDSPPENKARSMPRAAGAKASDGE
jgi:hypothetical protein